MIEVEQDNQLPFLDVMVMDDNGIAITDLYKKKTISFNRFLNYDSNHPLYHELNIINNRKHRILNFSNNHFHNKNFQVPKRNLKLNNYLTYLINKNLFFSK